MASFWDSITAPFTGQPIEEAAKAQQTAITAGMGQQAASYGSGQDALRNYYTSALAPYQALQGTAAGGTAAYADATGANGPEGLARANAQYMQATPGFAGAAQRAADLAARAGVSGGQATGNTLAGIADRTTQMGLQAFGDYTNRLAPWLNQGLGVAGGIAGANMGLGNQLNQSYDALGNAQYAGNAAFGNAQAEGLKAPMTAGSNIWNMGLNLGKMALGSGGLSSITGMFGQGAANMPSGTQGNPLLSTQLNPNTWQPAPRY